MNNLSILSTSFIQSFLVIYIITCSVLHILSFNIIAISHIMDKNKKGVIINTIKICIMMLFIQCVIYGNLEVIILTLLLQYMTLFMFLKEPDKEQGD